MRWRYGGNSNTDERRLAERARLQHLIQSTLPGHPDNLGGVPGDGDNDGATDPLTLLLRAQIASHPEPPPAELLMMWALVGGQQTWESEASVAGDEGVAEMQRLMFEKLSGDT